MRLEDKPRREESPARRRNPAEGERARMNCGRSAGEKGGREMIITRLSNLTNGSTPSSAVIRYHYAVIAARADIAYHGVEFD